MYEKAAGGSATIFENARNLMGVRACVRIRARGFGTWLEVLSGTHTHTRNAQQSVTRDAQASGRRSRM